MGNVLRGRLRGIKPVTMIEKPLPAFAADFDHRLHELETLARAMALSQSRTSTEAHDRWHRIVGKLSMVRAAVRVDMTKSDRKEKP